MQPWLLPFALLGLAYGFVLQRSGFCFARAAYELFLLRTREATHGVMAALLVATLGFGAVALVVADARLLSGGHLVTLPVGIGTLLGGAFFGAGMSLAGMCAAGTVVRAGEGYTLAWAVLAGILVAAVLTPDGMRDISLLPGPAPRVSLGQWAGPASGCLVTIAILVMLWITLGRGADSHRPGGDRARWSAKLHPLLMPPMVGGVLLGVLNTAQMAAASAWTVGYPLTLVPSIASGRSPQTVAQTALPLLVLDGCMALGALLAAALGGGLRLRWPRRAIDVVTGLAGGLLMGWGISMAHGCNVGGVLSAIPSLSLGGWLFLPAMLAGAWVGTRVISRLG